MTVTVDEFWRRLEASGLRPASAVETLRAALKDDPPSDGEDLAAILVRESRLTPYQAQAILQDRANRLVLGNYEILDLIGRGGMGLVFKARHRRMGRMVALKVLPPNLVDHGDALPRFRREVQAAALLEHPNIVTAYDADEADGVHFLVMQYVEGRNLASVVKDHGPLPLDQAVNFVLQTARALDYAHQKGILHRDVKPGNILVDRDGVARILDLGLARIAEHLIAAGDEHEELTQPGMVMGTASFMAPEQAVDVKAADHRADIYSLGCTLFYLVVGRTVYPAESTMRKILAHREEPIPSMTALHSSLPLELDAVFQRMVAKRAEDRYQSMGEVIVALQSCRLNVRSASRPEQWLEQSMAPTFSGGSPLPIPGPQRDNSITQEEAGSSSGTMPVTGASIVRTDSDSDPTVGLDRDTFFEDNRRPPPTPPRRSAWPWLLLILLIGAGVASWQFEIWKYLPQDTPLPSSDGLGDGPGDVHDERPPISEPTNPAVAEKPLREQPLPAAVEELPPAVAEKPGAPVNQFGAVLLTIDAPAGTQPTVFVDGAAVNRQRIGDAARLTLPVGDHVLVVQAAGLVPVKEIVRVVPNNVQRLKVQLRAPNIWDTAGPADNVLTGLVPRPAKLPEVARWQLESLHPCSRVTAVDLSRDGKRFVCGTASGRLRVYLSRNNELSQLFAAHAGPVTAVAFSPDDSLIASAGADGFVRLWSNNGEVGESFSWPDETPVALAWHRPPGRLRLAVCGGQTLWTFDIAPARPRLEQPQRLAVQAGHTLRDVAYSRSGQLAAAGDDGLVQMWPVNGESFSVPTVERAVLGLDWDSVRDTLAGIGSDGSVWLWNSQGRLIDKLQAPGEGWQSVAWGPDGDQIVVAGRDAGWPYILPVDGGTPEERLKHVTPAVVSRVVWQGNLMLSAGDTNILLWGVGARWIPALKAGGVGDVLAATAPRDGRIAVGTGSGNVEVWDGDGELLQRLKSHAATVTAVDWHPEGTQLASAAADGTVHLWNADTGNTIELDDPHAGPVTSLVWLTNDWFVTAGQDQTLAVWDNQGVLRRRSNEESVTVIIALPEPKTFAAAAGPEVWISNANGDRRTSAVPRQSSAVTALTVTSDGQRWAVGTADGRIAVYSNGNERIVQDRDETPVTALAWSPNGRWLAAANSSGMVRLWQGEQAEPTEFHTNATSVRSLIWDFDGQSVFTATNGSTLTRWTLTGVPRQTALLRPQGRPIQLSPGGQIQLPESVDSAQLDEFLTYLVENSAGELERVSPSDFVIDFPTAVVEPPARPQP